MPQPYTIQYGPWSPDLANVSVTVAPQQMVIDTPTADCLNIYYADGSYQSLPSPAQVSPFITNLAQPPLGAFTAIDSSGSPVIFLGTATIAYASVPPSPGVTPWEVLSGNYSAIQWRFTQFGQYVFAVDGSLTSGVADGLRVVAINSSGMNAAGLMVYTGSITSNVLTVTATIGGFTDNQLQVGTVISGIGVTLGTTILSLGTGTGTTGTYNLSTTPNVTSTTLYGNIPPVGNVIATVGQFLMQGDIGQQFANNTYGHNAYSLGTGDGTTRVFTGTIPNLPLRKGSIIPSNNGVTGGPDNGLGAFSTPLYVGTINYATGNISLTFTTAPANGNAILATYTQAFPARVWWSAIGLPEFWPAPLTNAALAFQSSYEDLDGNMGAVMGIAGYPLYAIIFQRNGITRATYQGGNVVFAFAPFEFKKGLVARGAYVQVGPNTYFLADDGFFVTDGVNVSPIGTAPDNSAGIDKWFWANVNTSALSAITTAYDATKRCVMFAIPTGSNTQPDTLLTYNVIAQRWTRATVPVSVIWSDTDGTRNRVGIFAQGATVTTPPYVGYYNYAYQLLTGAPAAGYMESCDLFFADGQRRLTTGARPSLNSADQPLVTIGNRDSLHDPVQYGKAAFPDRFSKMAPALSSGMYTRARVQSASATSIHGVTVYVETEGPI